jgi:hypothetical protein
METFEIMALVEAQAVQLVYVRAVLAEISNYFDRKEDEKYLGFYADQISNLLGVTGEIVFRIEPELQKIINMLQGKLKRERAEAREA